MSFNVSSKQPNKINNLLHSVPWHNGDVVTEMGSDLTLTYTDGQWLATDDPREMTISSKIAYAIKVQEPVSIPIGGTIIKDKDERTMDLNQGWNAIGYTPVTNLTVETALSDYYDSAEPGDVIKSHTEFAYFTKTGNTGRWRGSLQYMKPGEGYMMLRKGDGKASFTYPYFGMDSNFREGWSTSNNRVAIAAHRVPSTMTVSAVVEGFEMEEGDVLVAYTNGEIVGQAYMTNEGNEANVLYLSIGGEKDAYVWFAIERDGEIIAATDEVMPFTANAVIGSPDEPTAISFVKAEYKNDKWYTIGGIQLQQKPKQKGIYIFNNKKVMIK